jgi:hypothetical protein
MKTLIVEPLIGLSEIKLGDSRSAIHKLLGVPEQYVKYVNYSTDSYLDNQLGVAYDKNEIVYHIEFRNYIWNTKVLLFGQNIFETKVEDLFEIISSKTKFDYQQNYAEIPYAYKYPDLGLYLWREGLPSETDDKLEAESYSCFEYIGIGAKELIGQRK